MKLLIEIPDTYQAHAEAFTTWVSGRFANNEPPSIALFPGMPVPLLGLRLNPVHECLCCADNECECEGLKVN